MSIIEKLVGNVLDTRFEDFDRETVAQAKLRIIDTIGAAGAGADGCLPDRRGPVVRSGDRAGGDRGRDVVLDV